MDNEDLKELETLLAEESNIPSQQYKLYNRKKGRKLSNKILSAVETSETKYTLKLEDYSDTIKHYKKVCVEIGFGYGEHISYLASKNPDTLYIGCEVYLPGIANLTSIIERQDIKNIKIVNKNGAELLDAVHPKSIDEFYVLFPDPWPKTRHHRRRFVNTYNVSKIRWALKAEGIFIFASDVLDYAGDVMRICNDTNIFHLIQETHNNILGITTRYNAKANALGKKSLYLKYITAKEAYFNPSAER